MNLTKDMKEDIRVWIQFLQQPYAVARPFIDFEHVLVANDLRWYTDSAKGTNLGTGGICGRFWFSVMWESGFIEKFDPSIGFLELYGVAVSVLNWLHLFPGQRLILFCDNTSVVHMINNVTSKCKFCMKLI